MWSAACSTDLGCKTKEHLVAAYGEDTNTDYSTKLQMKQTLLSWVRNTNIEQQMPPFLRNKAAQVVVAMVQVRPSDPSCRGPLHYLDVWRCIGRRSCCICRS